MVLGVGVI